MRSVIVYLKDASESEVADFLSAAYTFQDDPKWPQWVLEKQDKVFLYIYFYRDMESEFEVEDRLALVEHFGGNEPTVCVIADVSGSRAGTDEVKEFACTLLQTFTGVATDDYTQHLWTYQEIEENARFAGHPFFDFQGWYDEKKNT